MGFWDGLMEGGITGIAKGVGSLAKDLRTAITGEEPVTAEQRTRLLEQVSAMEAATQAAAMQYDTVQMQGQVELNRIEAAADGLFKSGWRPAVGWVCVAGLAYTYVLRPILPWCVQVACIPFGYTSVLPVMPAIAMGDLLVLLGGLLGLGGMRSLEKIKKT